MPKALSFSFHALRFAARDLDCSQSPIFPWDRNRWVWLAAILVSWWERNCGVYKIPVGTAGRVNSVEAESSRPWLPANFEPFFFNHVQPCFLSPSGLLLCPHYMSIVRFYVMKNSNLGAKHLYFTCTQLLGNKETTVTQALPWHLPCNSSVKQPITSWFWSCHVSRM